MLKLKDKDGKVKFLVRDQDTGPVDIDSLVLEDLVNQEEEENEAESEKSE